MQPVEVGGGGRTQGVGGGVARGAATYHDCGPTEGAMWAARRDVARVSPQLLASIGRPLQNVCCEVLEAAASQVRPIGVWGELWLGGVQVARCYLHRPLLTAERCTAQPWRDASCRGVVYRRGDRVRWYAAGEIDNASAGYLSCTE